MSVKDKLVLFGPPGVGKSSVGNKLSEYGYYYFDGDSYSLPEGIALNRQGKGMTSELRDREYVHIFQNWMQESKVHERIVFDYHFTFDRYRINLRRLDSDLRWVYLAAPFQDVVGRLNRPGHLLSDIDFMRKIFDMFEEPSFPVTRIDATLPIDEVVRRVLDF